MDDKPTSRPQRFLIHDLLPSGRMDSTPERPQWQCLASSIDLQELMGLFGNFHDSCVREVHVVTGHFVEEDLTMRVDWRTTIHMLIQRQFRNPCAIELRFEEVVGLRMVPPQPDCVTIIFHAAFFVRDGVYYWAEDENWTPESTMMGQPGWRPGGCTGGTQASGLARASDIARRAECATIFVPASQRRDTGLHSGGNRFRQGSFREPHLTSIKGQTTRITSG